VDILGEVLTEGAYYDSGVNCISAKVGDNECAKRQEVSNGRVRFRSCNVGDEIEEKAIECYVNSKCNVYGLGSYVEYINVTDFEYCSDGVVGGDVQIKDFDLDESEYLINEDIEASVKVENIDIDEDDLDVVVKVMLYNIDEDSKVVEESDSQTIDYGDDEEFELTLTIPKDVDEDDSFVVLAKAYESGDEDDNCDQAKIFVNIKENDCEDDDDNDGFISEDCGGDDCDDSDSKVNPIATEICDDLIDNDCDGDVDGDDSECQECTSGQTRACGTDVGVCSKGIQTCVNSMWGECEGDISGTWEDCGDNLDNDCDGFTDCDDSNCYDDPACWSTPDDSDGDGLPDDWEIKYFGDLRYGWDDDPDGDGLANYEEWDTGKDPTVYDKQGGGVPWLLIILVLVVIGVVAVLVVFVGKGKGKKMVTSKRGYKMGGVKPTTARNADVLKDYVHKAMKRGFKRAQIEKVLFAKGWSKKEIDNAFRK
jgi:hypothetical protein